ncbi:biotin transport system permease protein [Klenkia soli]|uniref:Biotin transport system permease protein n=1 Tax=Klenkia soli TaxID=1052260 RepID=A0A1H0KIY6_9ACTN|nr:CbiQ family ECF transporter T component [Klenkia soli]SDO55875.1 biotin transport system permease protein [Klenkia soli]
MTLALYVPRTSPVHRLPAGVKLLVLLVLGVVVFVVPTLPAALGTLLAVVLVGLGAARLPVGLLLRQARAVAVWAAAIFVFHALATDVLTGAATAVRLLALVLAAAVVTATTRVTALVAVVERLCAPLRVFGVRPARIGLALAMALRFVPLVAERADRIREAQAARGGRVRGPRALVRLVVPLLVSVLQLAHTVGEALDARGADTA